MRKRRSLVLSALAATGLLIAHSCSNDSDSNYGNTNSNSSSYGQSAPAATQPAAVSSASLEFDVTNSGASSYVFNSDDLTDAEDPSLVLKRGETYTFNISTPGHPFYITTVQSTNIANAYDDGVTNNGTESGTIVFQVPSDAPDTLYYICEFHSSMSGEFTIED